MTPAERKADLRARVLAARDALPPAERALASEQLVARVRSLPEWQDAKVVMLYLGIKTEFDPLPLVEAALAAGTRVILPRMLRAERRLEIREIRCVAGDLLPGVWGLREPDPSRCALVAPVDIDFLLIPGVAFDMAGGRIGYGAGYYDRLLDHSGWRAARTAALFRPQLVAAVPREAHDLPVQTLVLPEGVLRMPGSL